MSYQRAADRSSDESGSSEGLARFPRAASWVWAAGFMIAHVAAVALLNEAKVLAHPASVDNLRPPAGKEDHVSMGMTAALEVAHDRGERGKRRSRSSCSRRAEAWIPRVRSSWPGLRARFYDLARSRAAAGRGPPALARYRGARGRDPAGTIRRVGTEDAPSMSEKRTIRAPRGNNCSCKGWHQEAALRMLHNNLDPEVAEKPDELIVYGGTGRAARDWPSFHAIVRALQSLENDETLLVQSGRPVGIFRTHPESPRVLIANSNLVGHWSNFDEFTRLEKLGLTMYGQMTAGSWIYIGSQGIVQGTYETFAALGRKHFGGSLAGKIVVSGGMGGMGGAQPLAATMNGALLSRHRRRSAAHPAAPRDRLLRPALRATLDEALGDARHARGASRSAWSATAPTCSPSWCAAASCPTS